MTRKFGTLTFYTTLNRPIKKSEGK